ncbi:MAG: FecR family protein [Sulfurospirillaceae bacterium]|nr:FecR family protein [Sulfurospirillaceae bacterium]MDD3462846.1 FecR family protein [Sulfurospirillaceae bacterium]
MKQLFGIATCLIGMMCFAGEGIAIVKSVEGQVNVKRDNTTFTITPKEQIQKNDILMTGEKSGIGLIFHDGSVLYLGQNSNLRVDEFTFKPLDKEFKFNLSMDKGSALFESGKIGTLAPDSFQFKIPEGTVGIRGTKFIVEVQ